MFRLRTLGVIDLRDPSGRPVREVLAQPKRIALLIFLAVEGARAPVARDRVLAMFWPEADEEHARNALSQALYHLRQALGSEAITGSRGTVLEIAGAQLSCDAVDCEAALTRGEAEHALTLFTGEFAPALHVVGAPAFSEWVSEHGRHLRRRLLAGAATTAARLERTGEISAASRVARSVIALQPEDEREVRSALALMERAGDVTWALQAYTEYADAVRSSLDTEPSVETVALVRDMRARHRAGNGSAGAATESTTDAGTPERQESAEPSESRRARRASRRTPVLVGVAASAIVLAGSVALTARSGRGDEWRLAADRPVAILPFEAHGGEFARVIGAGMSDLLAARMDGTPPLRPIDPRSTGAALTDGPRDAVAAQRVADRFGARYVVLGSVTQVAGTLEFEAALYESGRLQRPKVRATARGDTAALFAIVDELAGRLLSGVSEGRDTTLVRLAARTTAELPALKAYLHGERALREGRDAEAAAAFREAIAIDSSFALAYFRYAMLSVWVATPTGEQPLDLARTAARHAARLPPLPRDLLDGYLAYRAFERSAADRFSAITQAHPENLEAWFMLGEVQFHLGSRAGRSALEARDAFTRVLALDPSHHHALVHLARIAAMEGDTAALGSIVRRFAAERTEPNRWIEVRALDVWVRGDTAAARHLLHETARIDEVVGFSLGTSAAMHAVALDQARPILERLAASHRAPYLSAGRRILADLDLARGRLASVSHLTTQSTSRSPEEVWVLESAAQMASEPAFAFPRERVAPLRTALAAPREHVTLTALHTRASPAASAAQRSYLVGLLDLALGDELAVGRAREDLRAAATERGDTLASALLKMLDAERLRRAGRNADAAEQFATAGLALSGTWPIHFGLSARFAYAEALLALGRDAEALPLFESYSEWSDLPYIGIASLRQGEIHERAGRRSRAAMHYARALSVWRDADPQFAPLVRSARDGLARVQPRI